jgi:zinc ribbon protein
MFCPKCGSKNKDEIKFCTRCGTNLAIVSDALNGKLASIDQHEKRRVKLMKEYYDGRTSAVLGVPFLLIGAATLSFLMAKDLMDKFGAIGLVGLGCMIYGAIALVAGIGMWVQSSSEMKALGYQMPPRPLARPQQEQLAAPPAAFTDTVKVYATDPITAPASVTEQTTRNLEEGAYPQTVGPQSQNTQ